MIPAPVAAMTIPPSFEDSPRFRAARLSSWRRYSSTAAAPELAVRLAMGATHGRILRLVVGEGARLIVLGLLIGIPGVYMAGQAIKGFLVGVSPFDTPTLVVTSIGLVTVTLLACYLGARRVTAIQPARLLNEE